MGGVDNQQAIIAIQDMAELIAQHGGRGRPAQQPGAWRDLFQFAIGGQRIAEFRSGPGEWAAIRPSLTKAFICGGV